MSSETKARDSDQKQTATDFTSSVGELILLSSQLDLQLAKLMVPVLNLLPSELLIPTLSSLETSAKIEILLSRASFFTPKTRSNLREELKSFLNDAIELFKFRNIASHTPLISQNDQLTLQPVALVRLLKNIKLEPATCKTYSIEEIKKRIKDAEELLARSEKLIKKFSELDTKFRNKANKNNASKKS